MRHVAEYADKFGMGTYVGCRCGWYSYVKHKNALVARMAWNIHWYDAVEQQEITEEDKEMY